MSDEVVDVDLPVHVPIHDLRNVGAPLGPAKSAASPIAASHELKRPRGDLFTSASDSDDHGGAPTFVTALQRLPHDADIAHAFEREIRATTGEFDEVLHEIRSHFRWVHEVSD